MKGATTFAAAVAGCPSIRPPTALKYINSLLTVLLEKSLSSQSIIQKLLLEYLSNASLAAVKDMVGLCAGEVTKMMHTKDGTRVGVRCVTHGAAKERKVIVKALKGIVEGACCSDYGHQVYHPLSH